MRSRGYTIGLLLLFAHVSLAQQDTIVESGPERSGASVRAVKVADRLGVAVHFQGTSDLHYYANKESAPGGFALQVETAAEGVQFGDVEFPKQSLFYDRAFEKEVEVFVGDFTVFIPIVSAPKTGSAEVTVKIGGIACTSKLCLPPFEKILSANFCVDFLQADFLYFGPSFRKKRWFF